MGGIRSDLGSEVGSCAVWFRGNRDTASVMQRPCDSCFRTLKIADKTCDEFDVYFLFPDVVGQETGGRLLGRRWQCRDGATHTHPQDRCIQNLQGGVVAGKIE